MNQKIITIITVVYNAKADLALTLNSLSCQTFKDFEYLIIDGGSSDGTQDIVDKYDSIVTKLVSERDFGIYHAMNKGILLANGRYLLFLNAGDQLYSPNTLMQARPFLEKSEEDFIYGTEAVLVYGEVLKKKPLKFSQLWKGMPFSHQSVFIKTEFHKTELYDLSFKIGADYNLIYKSFMSKRTFKKIDQVIAIVSPGGVSDVRRVQCFNERLKTHSNYPLTFKTQAYYRYLILDACLRIFLKKMLPAALVKKIILLKYTK